MTVEAPPIRLMLVDDHVGIAEGLALVLDQHPRLDGVGAARDEAAALAMVSVVRPDVILLDVHLPGPSGLDFGPELVRRAPGTRLVVLSAYGNPAYVLRALAMGAAGYCVKQASSRQIAEAVLTAAAGGQWFSPAARRTAVAMGQVPPDGTEGQLVLLSPRERQVVLLRASGASIADTAAELDIATSTVRTHWDRALHRLGLEAMPLQLLAAWGEG